MKMMDCVTIGLAVWIIILCGLLYFGHLFMEWRADLIFNIRRRAADARFSAHTEEEFQRRVRVVEQGPGYSDMVWAFTKWKVEHFYPDLVRTERGDHGNNRHADDDHAARAPTD